MIESLTVLTNDSLDRFKFLLAGGLLSDELQPSLTPAQSEWPSAGIDVYGKPSISIIAKYDDSSVEASFSALIEHSHNGIDWVRVDPSLFVPPIGLAELGAPGDLQSIQFYLRTHFIRVVFATETRSNFDGVILTATIIAGEV